MSEWIEHDGGRRPVGMLDVVQVKFRDHERVKDDFIADTGFAADWSWWHDGADDDIVRYRIVSPSPTPSTPPKTGV